MYALFFLEFKIKGAMNCAITNGLFLNGKLFSDKINMANHGDLALQIGLIQHSTIKQGGQKIKLPSTLQL